MYTNADKININFKYKNIPKVSHHNDIFDKQNVCLQTYRDNRIC